MKICNIVPGQQYESSVIALGNFDGVHLGHQSLLKCGYDKAKALHAKLSVLVFDPHPLKVLYPERRLNLITGMKERLMLFEEIGVDKVFLLPFTKRIATTLPREFMEDIVLKIGAIHVVVGFNYSFGSQGKGTPEDLEEFGQEYGFGVSILQAQMLQDRVISSTEIRRFLLKGEIDAARKMMGRSPIIAGTVVHGDGRGRELGFPTANIQLDEDLLIPRNGVYAVTSEMQGKIYGGMMNIGVRPTFAADEDRTIEVYFFDYKGSLYGQNLVITIESRLRSERKFSGVDEIISQLQKDKEEAVSVLSSLRFRPQSTVQNI